MAAYAGHDAGVLARHLPAAMLFVRNPTGISHNPAESASEEDCLAACAVLARALVRPRCSARADATQEPTWGQAPCGRSELRPRVPRGAGRSARAGARAGGPAAAGAGSRPRRARGPGVVLGAGDELDRRRPRVGVGRRRPARSLAARRARGREHLIGAAEGVGQRARPLAQLDQRDGVVGRVVELRGGQRLGAPPVGAVAALRRAEQPARDGGERGVAALVGRILDRPVALEDAERAARVEDVLPGRQAEVPAQPRLLVAGVVRDDLAPVGEQAQRAAAARPGSSRRRRTRSRRRPRPPPAAGAPRRRRATSRRARRAGRSRSRCRPPRRSRARVARTARASAAASSTSAKCGWGRGASGASSGGGTRRAGRRLRRGRREPRCAGRASSR